VSQAHKAIALFKQQTSYHGIVNLLSRSRSDRLMCHTRSMCTPSTNDDKHHRFRPGSSAMASGSSAAFACATVTSKSSYSPAHRYPPDSADACHGDVRPTMIYTHTVTADLKPLQSPLDLSLEART
jgi:hypothetical protein